MRLDTIHVSVGRPELPDAGGGLCCIGAAALGPERCTCWEPVYDAEQLEPDLEAPPTYALTCCADCAFRAGSPERSGDESYKHAGEGELEALAERDDGVFYCHQGMRRVVKWRHRSGVEVEAHPGEYAPAKVGMQAFRANGAPADVCRGFAEACRRRRRAERDWPSTRDSVREE